MTNCLICNKEEKVEFLDNYKPQFKEDESYFKKAKLYRCDNCDFSLTSCPNVFIKIPTFSKFVIILP